MYSISDKFDQHSFSNSNTIPKEILEDFLKTSADYFTQDVFPASHKTSLNQNQPGTTQRRKQSS